MTDEELVEKVNKKLMQFIASDSILKLMDVYQLLSIEELNAYKKYSERFNDTETVRQINAVLDWKIKK